MFHLHALGGVPLKRKEKKTSISVLHATESKLPQHLVTVFVSIANSFVILMEDVSQSALGFFSVGVQCKSHQLWWNSGRLCVRVEAGGFTSHFA